MGMPPVAEDRRAARVGFGAFLRLWFSIGCLSFGGPAAQIALMHREIVDRRRSLDDATFLTGLNFCWLLPGPEAQQLATFIGWRLHGVAGGVAAGVLFILPGALVMLALSWLVVSNADRAWLADVFDGLKPVVVAIIFVSVWRLARRTLNGWPAIALAAGAFVLLYGVRVDFPWVVAFAAAIGAVTAWLGSAAFRLRRDGAGGAGVAAAAGKPRSPRPVRRLPILLGLFAILWALPVVIAITAFGPDPFLGIAKLFTTAAFVTFGGAYAVLPYVADRAVHEMAWLSQAQMLNGLALAETTPGPLILVLQYVGFLAGWNASGGNASIAVAAALLTTYVTFLPSFLFIFAGAPYIERLHAVTWLASSLAAINAAVVGVLLSLGVYFAEPVFLGAEAGVFPLAIAAGAAFLLLRFDISVQWVIALGAASGLLHGAL